MNRKFALLTGTGAGVVTLLLLRRRAQVDARGGPALDPRAEELRRKLAEARETTADEEDFEAAGMAGETMIEEEPRPTWPAAAMSGGDVDEIRRGIHEEARAASEEMRRANGPEET
jgi:hypothetical protein